MPAGKPVYTFSHGSLGGTPLFFGARAPGHGNYARDVRRPYAAQALAWFKDGDLQSGPPSPPVLGIVASAAGVRGVGFTGEVFALSDGGWKLVCKGPKKFSDRDSANLGCDNQGRVLLTGGEPTQGSKYLTDAWLFADGKWTEIVAKGSAPVATKAGVGFDPARGVWVVVGGGLKSFQPSPKTYEYDGKKWSAYPTHLTQGKEIIDGESPFVVWDETSGQLFCVATHQYVRLSLFVYRGEGAWERLASFDDLAGSAVAYDAGRRTLVAVNREQLAEVAIGPTLDGAVKTAATAKKQPAAKTEEAIPSAVWLKLQQGAREEFWFASHKGTTWTVRSGLRGGKVTEKTNKLAAATTAKAAYEKAVRAKLEKGYEHAPEKEAAAIIPGKTSHRIKLGKAGEDDFGGLPAGITKDTWPTCADCSRPMMHVLTLHAHEERLPLRKHAALVLFVCSSEGGVCETWDADCGCNAAVLLTAAALRKKALGAAPKGAGGEKAPEVIKARKITYRPEFEADPEANENAEDIPAVSKVGGYPGWLQGDDTPTCETCEKPMSFVAQLNEIDDTLNFGGGDGYLFCCPDEHAAKFLWQQ